MSGKLFLQRGFCAHHLVHASSLVQELRTSSFSYCLDNPTVKRNTESDSALSKNWFSKKIFARFSTIRHESSSAIYAVLSMQVGKKSIGISSQGFPFSSEAMAPYKESSWKPIKIIMAERFGQFRRICLPLAWRIVDVIRKTQGYDLLAFRSMCESLSQVEQSSLHLPA